MKFFAIFSIFIIGIFIIIPKSDTFKVMKAAQILKIENNKSLSVKDKIFIEKLKNQILTEEKNW